MESPHVKYELSFEEYQNLVEQFNNLVKTKDFKPLNYIDYRKVAGKHLNGIVSKVVIEFVDESHFIITFHPTRETIYAGNIFDLSFGTFIKDHFRKELKEMIENNNTYNENNNTYKEKNNTYDIWGTTVSATSTMDVASSTISSNMSNNSSCSNVLGVDYTPITSYYSLPQDYYRDLEKRLQKLEEAKVKIKEDLDDICSKLDLDRIYSTINEISREITKNQSFNGYRFDDIDYRIESIKEKIDELSRAKEDKKCDKRKDNEKTMNTNKMFNFDFGFVDSNIRMSPYGMAIRNADGRYVSYDVKTGSVIDVEPFNFEGNRFMMKMPVAVKDVAVGDIVIHNHKPMFVVNTNDKVTVIDIYNGEEKNILLTKNMFGFDFVTKVVSFINFSNASAENPFGNMWPLFMLSDGNSGFDLNGANSEDSRTKMLMLMMMMSQNGMPANMFQNPMFMMAIMGDGNPNMQDFMMVMAMSSAMNNNNTDFKITTTPAVIPPNNQ